MKKTYLEQLGMEPVKKLNKTICLERVRHLKKILRKNKLKGKLLSQAKYYEKWYKWMATNGGTRGKSAA